MKIKEGFILREIMGNYVVVAVGSASKDFRGMIKLNSTAVDIWNLIQEGKDENEICELLLNQYDVERDQLEKDIRATINRLIEQGILENE